MTTATKAQPNWSDAQLEKFANANDRGGKIDKAGIAILLTDPLFKGVKTDKMIQGKLVSMGMYKKAEESKRPSGVSGVRKPQIVRGIEALTGIEKEGLETLEKGSKPHLERLLEVLKAQSDQNEATDSAEVIKAKREVIAKLEERARVKTGTFESMRVLSVATIEKLVHAEYAPSEQQAALANDFDASM